LSFWLGAALEGSGDLLDVVEVDVPEAGAESLGFDAALLRPAREGARGYAGEKCSFADWSEVL